MPVWSCIRSPQMLKMLKRRLTLTNLEYFEAVFISCLKM